MTDGKSKTLPKPKYSRRWTSFVAVKGGGGRVPRGLQEEVNPKHRLRVEHNPQTLLIHLSDEDGNGWTTIAVDRPTREWAIAHRRSQLGAAQAAHALLYK